MTTPISTATHPAVLNRQLVKTNGTVTHGKVNYGFPPRSFHEFHDNSRTHISYVEELLTKYRPVRIRFLHNSHGYIDRGEKLLVEKIEGRSNRMRVYLNSQNTPFIDTNLDDKGNLKDFYIRSSDNPDIQYIDGRFIGDSLQQYAYYRVVNLRQGLVNDNLGIDKFIGLNYNGFVFENTNNVIKYNQFPAGIGFIPAEVIADWGDKRDFKIFHDDSLKTTGSGKSLGNC